jgi:integrase
LSIAPKRTSGLEHRYFYSVLKRAGLPRIRFHDLRHTAATFWLRRGVHPKVVQELLGPSTAAFTLQVYSHVLPGLKEQAVYDLGALLLGRVPAAD